MRRLLIVYYWFFKSKNNVSFYELIRFFFKPTVHSVADRYIKDIKMLEGNYGVTFKNLRALLFWPCQFPIEGIYQVTSETFDKNDWHYYQKKFTEVVNEEVILDVGTAEGLFILSVINRCKRIILVEPNDYFAAALNKTFASYQDKVILHNVVVGSQNGEISFNSDSLSGRVDFKGNSGMLKRMETVDHLTLNELPITYLKADIEGYEIEMLKGAENTIKKHKPKIAITSYHTENNAEEIISLVKGFVPEYNHYVKGIFHEDGKPVMIHFWIGAS